MKSFSVTIEGVSGLIQHRFSEQSEGEVGAATRTVGIGHSRGTPREQAEHGAYRHPDGTLYHPGAAIGRLLRESGSNHKVKGSRKSVKFLVPAAILVLDDTISLHQPGNVDSKITDYEVDSRPVVIPATKGRVMRHRPRLDKWAMTFNLEVDDELLPPDFAYQLLSEGGKRLGIGDYRVERGGPFGRFQITNWVEIKD